MIYIFMPKKCPFDLVFPCRNREKCLYCVVWFTSAEFYGFGRRVERKQKGPLPPAPGMFVMKQPPLLLLSLLPVPLNPSEQRAPTVMHTHTDTVHFNRHWRHFRHGLQYLQKTLTWSHALDNRGVSDPWGGVSAGVQSCPRWERNRQIIQCCENVCTSP